MARFTFISVTVLSAIAALTGAGAAPLRLRRAVTQTAANFKELAYADFQISSGTGGTAQAEANAVFVDPFAGTDLTTVSSDVLTAMNNMREAAESAETEDFNPQIDAASGAAADALQVGKIKNKVLKLTGEVQVLNIKIAQAKAKGSDTSDLESSLADEQTKLTTNIATDKSNAGKASQAVAGAAAAAAPASSSAAAKATSTKAAASKTTAAAAAPTANTDAVTQTAANFKELDYADFQISDGTGGDAEAQANAVFVDPFAGADLTTVSSDVLTAMNNMREAAESAETDDFNPQIAAASGAAADALQVGKIKNKVLKLTGEVQVLNIKIAQAKAKGSDTSDLESSLADEQTKLSTNIATDKASAGKPSQGVA
ncbi:hypothetical protein PsYK624_073720 [Phanerochaete sordida]|uniref:Small secreted protein n=1 Tax=Phanerochaete sordida TaxID=48140 RepID=A0A9P3GAA5_9APHY|nr:hypothetical protein PsYK624_073720 [Phanerochaete sordida]